MTKLRMSLIALVSLLAAAPASAQNFICSVNPTLHLGVNAAGWIAVAVNGSRTVSICSVSQTVGGVTPEACSAWYSSLLTWRTTGKSGWIYFDSGNSANQGNTGCAQFPSPEWSVRIPYHIDAA